MKTRIEELNDLISQERHEICNEFTIEKLDTLIEYEIERYELLKKFHS